MLDYHLVVADIVVQGPAAVRTEANECVSTVCRCKSAHDA